MKNYFEGFQEDGSGERKSFPGIYQGYSKRLYDGVTESSQYVAVRDGTRMAVELYRPSLMGKTVEEPLPVVWRFTPYGRILRRPDGSVRHTAFFSGTGVTVPDEYNQIYLIIYKLNISKGTILKCHTMTLYIIQYHIFKNLTI